MLTLILPWPSADLSPNGRAHHFARARLVKSAKLYAHGLTLAAMPALGIIKRTWRGPISVQFTFHPEINRARDDDNFIARMKPYRDGAALALGVDDTHFRTEPVVFGEKAKPAFVRMTLTPDLVDLPKRGAIT
jgi:crossover junction endodeoxyribonuclease RusA